MRVTVVPAPNAVTARVAVVVGAFVTVPTVPTVTDFAFLQGGQVNETTATADIFTVEAAEITSETDIYTINVTEI